MSLQEIKDNYAKSVGYDNWEDLEYSINNEEFKNKHYYHLNDETDNHIDQVMKLYAMECLKKASENMKQTAGQWNADFSSQKRSIHNESNLV